MTRYADKDSYQGLYPCGHKISVPAAHLMGGGHFPGVCPICEQDTMNQKWVHQEEAKIWAHDPKWAGFVNHAHYGASVSSGASVMFQPERNVPTGPLAWLDFQIESVRRRAAL